MNCFTGQPFIGDPVKENVECAVCKESINLRSDAWFDKFNKTYEPSGCYVHYHCLSPQRKAEIKLEMETPK